MEQPYRVLLVDDEPIILRSLKAALPWKELGMEVAGEARNGEEGYRQCKRWEPHIIISDIRMPTVDGIQLMKRVLEERSGVVFVLLSGYGEFEYAREAIRQGAFDYLLKPIDHEELEQVLKEAAKYLDENRNQKTEVEYLRKSVQSLSSLVRERMLAEMIEGTGQPHPTLYWLDEWELEHPYYMMVVALDDYASTVKRWSEDEKKLWFFAVRNVLQEYTRQKRCLTSFPFHHGEWVVIFQQVSRKDMLGIGRELIEVIKRYTKLSCSVGISRRHQGLDSLHLSYRSAQNALFQRFLQGKHSVYCDEPSRLDGRDHDLAYPEETEKQLVQAIKLLQEERFQQQMDRLEQEIKHSSCTREAAERTLLELIVVLHRQLESLDMIGDFPLEPLLDRLSEAETLEEMTGPMRRYFADGMKKVTESALREDGSRIVGKAIDYIESRYHHDLGIDEVSEFVGISCSHFCVLFKQETGYTFLEYLTRYRIEKACSILENSDVKVYQVAPLVGYQDPRYFTQVFKKNMGMTPTEYREKNFSKS